MSWMALAAGVVLTCDLIGCHASPGRFGFVDAGRDANGDGALADRAPDRPLDDNGTCEMECFHSTRCVRGAVSSTTGLPSAGPCGTPPPCWTSTYSCTEGCSLQIEIVGPWAPYPPGGEDLPALCTETPSKRVGDDCGASSCLPNRGHVAADGGVETTYLACDVSTRKCVATSGPPAGDFGSACESPGPLLPGPGFSSGTPCPHGYCLRVDDADGACAHTACTALCWGDHQCPSGWTCDDSLTNLSSTSERLAVCRPGLAHTPLPRGFCGGAPDGGGSD
jgi:hypothetical protein